MLGLLNTLLRIYRAIIYVLLITFLINLISSQVFIKEILLIFRIMFGFLIPQSRFFEGLHSLF